MTVEPAWLDVEGSSIELVANRLVVAEEADGTSSAEVFDATSGELISEIPFDHYLETDCGDDKFLGAFDYNGQALLLHAGHTTTKSMGEFRVVEADTGEELWTTEWETTEDCAWPTVEMRSDTTFLVKGGHDIAKGRGRVGADDASLMEIEFPGDPIGMQDREVITWRQEDESAHLYKSAIDGLAAFDTEMELEDKPGSIVNGYLSVRRDDGVVLVDLDTGKIAAEIPEATKCAFDGDSVVTCVKKGEGLAGYSLEDGSLLWEAGDDPSLKRYGQDVEVALQEAEDGYLIASMEGPLADWTVIDTLEGKAESKPIEGHLMGYGEESVLISDLYKGSAVRGSLHDVSWPWGN